VLYIDVPRRVRNPKYRELGLEPIEASVRTEVGKVLAPTELEKAPEMIDSLLVNYDDIRRRIVQFRNKVLFNIGRSVEAGAAAIAAAADSVKAKRKAAE
jgi:YidC/Oxa1 family membrane protein insertase